MFWDESKNDFLGDIDNIKLVRKIIPKKVKTKRKIAITQLLLIFLILEIAFCGVFGYKKTQGKTDALRLFANGKYLILLQNNAELRPAGGFIGSFAVVTFKNYQVEKIDFNANIYTLDKNYTKIHKTTPPDPLALINENWSMRDSNFAVSFPDAANQVEWFYEQESGDTVDGVIALNASLIRDLISKIGPVNLANGIEINADNFFVELNKQVEQAYYNDTSNWIENQPKEILAEMMPIVFRKALAQNKIELAKFFKEELKKKELQFFSNNIEIETAILAENWGGAIRDFPGDYLEVNNANIGGMKSSINIKENISYDVSFTEDETLADLTIIRSHTGSGVWPDGVNKNYTQILVPKNAVLKSAELNGKDILNTVKIGEEAGKTVYGVWVNTMPAASNVLNLKYTLPVKENNYQLLVQKQSGSLNENLVVIVDKKVFFDNALIKDELIK